MKNIMMLMMSAVLLTACQIKLNDDKGSEATSVRHCRPFEQIEMNGYCKVIFVQSDTFGVKVVGPRKQVDNVITSFDGGTLKIDMSESFSHKMCTVYVTSPDLIRLTVDGAGSFKVDKPLDTDTLQVFMKGVGKVDIDRVICDKMSITLQGLGKVEVDHLTTQYADVQLKGVGKVDLDFDYANRVNCTLQGVGEINLSGKVIHLNHTTQGSGKIDTSDLMVGP